MDAKKIPNGRAATNAAYGVPDEEGSPWYHANIINLRLPFTLYYEGDGGLSPVSTVQFHIKAAPNLYAALLAVWLCARVEVKKAHDFDPRNTSAQWDNLTAKWLADQHLSRYNGTYEYRKIRGSSAISTHSYGIAIDLDASENPLGATKTTFPAWFIDCFRDQGFLWGGDFTNRKDNQHFQLARGV